MREYEGDGFEQPLHRSLTEEVTLLGAPRKIVILNGGLTVMGILILKSLYILPFNIILFIITIMISKRDPQFLDCFIRYLRTKDYYHT